MSFVSRWWRTETELQKALLLNGEGSGCSVQKKKIHRKIQMNQTLSLDPERFGLCVI